MAILTVVLLSLALMLYCKLELSYKLGVYLLLLYCGYFLFELRNNAL